MQTQLLKSAPTADNICSRRRMEISPTPTGQGLAFSALRATEAQVKILKSALETQVDAVAALLEMIGIGQQIDITA